MKSFVLSTLAAQATVQAQDCFDNDAVSIDVTGKPCADVPEQCGVPFWPDLFCPVTCNRCPQPTAPAPGTYNNNS